MKDIHRISQIETAKSKCTTWEITKKELLLRIPFYDPNKKIMILEYHIPLDKLREALKEEE